LDVAKREIKEFFNIWDYAERVEFIGGEPLMHPNILEIVKEMLKYKDCFSRMRITTNATIIPSDELCELVASCGRIFDFIVDDYGEYSKNLEKVINKLEYYNIPYRLDIYHGDNQRYNGWVIYGEYVEAQTKDSAEFIFNHCNVPRNQFVCVNNGKVFSCNYAQSLYWVKGIFPTDGSAFDLFDESVSREQKRNFAKDFFLKPIQACEYCYGFSNDFGERFPAAEQI